MPRHEANNPTERMLRVMSEFEALVVAYDNLAAIWLAQGHFMPPGCARPNLESFAAEKVRLQLTYGNTRKTRQSMAKLRARGGAAKSLAESDMTLDDRPKAIGNQTLSIEEIERRLSNISQAEADAHKAEVQATLDRKAHGDPIASKLDPKKLVGDL